MAVFMTYNFLSVSLTYYSCSCSNQYRLIHVLCVEERGEERVERGERGVEVPVLAWYFGNTCIYMYIWNYSAIISVIMFQPPRTRSNHTPPSQVRDSSVTMTVSFSPTLEELKTSGNRKLSSAQSS